MNGFISSVFELADLHTTSLKAEEYIGWMTALVEGTIAVMVGGEGAEAGAAMPEGAISLAAGASFGYVTLPVGEQTVHVQRFDKAGKAVAGAARGLPASSRLSSRASARASEPCAG